MTRPAPRLCFRTSASLAETLPVSHTYQSRRKVRLCAAPIFGDVVCVLEGLFL
jgi:hypothetical protein